MPAQKQLKINHLEKNSQKGVSDGGRQVSVYGQFYEGNFGKCGCAAIAPKMEKPSPTACQVGEA